MLSGEPVVGAKIDLSKAFDRISPALAMKVMQTLGLPLHIVDFVMRFYDRLNCWFVDPSCSNVGSTPVSRINGLLQGCPLSMALIAATMSLCVWFVDEAASGVQLGIFVDDRLLWAAGEQSVNNFDDAVAAISKFDGICKWKWNHGKGLVFALRQNLLSRSSLIMATRLALFRTIW